MLSVIGDIPGELVRPKFFMAFRGGSVRASGMPVPEASVNEDDGAMFGQDDVRLSCHIQSMQPEAIAGPVKQGAHYALGASILALDLRHHQAPLCYG